MQYRLETDSMGEIQVPYDKYYTAQTGAVVDSFQDRRRAHA